MDKLFSVMGSFGKRSEEEARRSASSDDNRSLGSKMPSRDKRNSIASILNADYEVPSIPKVVTTEGISKNPSLPSERIEPQERHYVLESPALSTNVSRKRAPTQSDRFGIESSIVAPPPSNEVNGERPITSEKAFQVATPDANNPEKHHGNQETDIHATSQSATTDSEETAPEPRFEIASIKKHRWVGDHYEHCIEWKDGDVSWVDEFSLHADCPSALQEYWGQREEGARPPNLESGGEAYNVFAIKKDRKSERELLVEWVGYNDTTWEPTVNIRVSNKELVQDYFENKRRVKKRKKRSGLATMRNLGKA